MGCVKEIFYRRAAKSFVLACRHSGEASSWDEGLRHQYQWFRDTLAGGLEEGDFSLGELPAGLREGFCYLMISAEAFSQYRKCRKRAFMDFLGTPGDHSLVIFGCGDYGSSAYRFLAGQRYAVYAFMDNDETLWGQRIDGIEVLPPGEIPKCGRGTRYIVANEKHAGAIEAQILGLAGDGNAKTYRFSPEIV